MRSHMSRGVAAVATLLLVAGVVALLARDRADGPDHARGAPGPGPSELLAMPPADDGFAPVRPGRTLAFPTDHGAHPRQRTEWWYLTGTLDTADERPIGLQLAVMRIGLAANPDTRPSRWAASSVYAGFLTLSRPGHGSPVAGRRVARAALGLAGAEPDPVRIRVEDWHLQRAGDAGMPGGWRLQAATDDMGLALELQPRKPIVGADELRGAGTDDRPPFRFYLQPRMQAHGTLSLGARRTPVTGTVAMEHAWGELPLPGGPVARDRFTLHLEDGRDLFVIRTHRVGDTAASSVGGLLVDGRGRRRVLSDDDIELTPTEEWVSERSDTAYPVRWALRIRDHGIDLTIAPVANDQEVTIWAPVWAGPVELRGRAGGSTQGSGFMQLSGYDDNGNGR